MAFKSMQSDPAHWQAMLERAPIAILSMDHEGRLNYVNKAAETLFGYSKKEFLGKSSLMLVPKSLQEKRHEVLEKAKKKGFYLDYRTKRKTKRGKIFPITADVYALDSGIVAWVRKTKWRNEI